MIEIKHLYKRYHNRDGRDNPWVLQDINLIIPTGVSVGLVGRNGAGKSTLLRLIAGMDKADKGEIIRHARVSWPIGLAGGFQGSMTGRQNVKFVARVHGGGLNVAKIIDFVEEFAELGDAFDWPIKNYSSGMRSRLNFGLSLAFDFDVYLSDEATAVGDRAFKNKASKAFKDKVGQSSLIMVSHAEGILKDLCQAGIYLKDGQANWFDDINDAIAAYHEETGGDAKPAGQRPNANRPGQGPNANRPGAGPNANRPGQGPNANRPGQGPHARRPGQGPNANRPGQGPNANRPGAGPNARRPGQGPNANRPAGPNARRPGQGPNANRPGQGPNAKSTGENPAVTPKAD
ncbi:ABC transporter ATP-binding protein [Zobellella endophytica]|uniref:ABC transporter ATP-binding protein n=1 Tax=Zobellella endophytica TaxID=2116700 RepID=UPI001FE39B1F|nr:ABC transporter ATP-binding protein [Zobellella endophytica]